MLHARFPVAPTPIGDDPFGLREPGVGHLKLALGLGKRALHRRFLPIQLGALVGKPHPPGFELGPLQLLPAHLGGTLALGLSPLIQLGAGVRHAVPSRAQRVLRLGLGVPGLEVAPEARVALRLRRTDGGAQLSGVRRDLEARKFMDLGTESRGHGVQLALLGVDRGALLRQRGQLGGQRGVVRARLESDGAGVLHLAARRITGALGTAVARPGGIRRLLRRGQSPLRVEQPGARARRIPSQLEQPRPLLQPGGGGATGIRSPHEAVPAPQATIPADQPLALPQVRLQPLCLVGIDHADLGEPAAQGRRPAHDVGQRGATRRQGMIFRSVPRILAPMARRRRIQPGQQIVAERGGERLGIARRDLGQIDDLGAVGLRSGQIGKRADLGLEPLERGARAPLGALCRSERRLGRARAIAGRLERRLGVAELTLGKIERTVPRGEVELGPAARPLILRLGELAAAAGKARPALLQVLPARVQGGALLGGVALRLLGGAQALQLRRELRSRLLQRAPARLAPA